MNIDQSSSSVSNPELEEFRKDWLNEVKNKYHDSHSNTSTSVGTSANTHSVTGEEPLHPLGGQADQSKASSHNENSKHHEHFDITSIKNMSYSERKSKALEVYILAVQKEQEGNLGQALLYYRRAFKYDADVDLSYRTYLRKESEENKTNNKDSSLFGKSEEDFEFIKHLHLDDDYKSQLLPSNKENDENYHATLKKFDPLHELIESWFNPPSPDEKEEVDPESTTELEDAENPAESTKDKIPNLLEYGARDQNKPVFMNLLPKNLIVKILQCLILQDMQGVHNFSLTCKRSFLLSREQSLWKHLVDLYYHPMTCNYKNFQKVNPDTTIDEFVDEYYLGVYQYFWTEYPKIRYDGIYISTCYYIRQGAAENTFHNPVHLVTYYRYIRFYPDGTLLKVLTPDEPVNVVKQLHKQSKYKGIMPGHFETSRDYLNITFRDPQSHRNNVTFVALLNLKSTHRAHFNKLTWLEYYSTDIRDVSFEDRSIYSLKQFKPFYFSKVKSIRNWLNFSELSI